MGKWISQNATERKNVSVSPTWVPFYMEPIYQVPAEPAEKYCEVFKNR